MGEESISTGFLAEAARRAAMWPWEKARLFIFFSGAQGGLGPHSRLRRGDGAVVVNVSRAVARAHVPRPLVAGCLDMVEPEL